MLGTGCSGKSTVLSQIKYLHSGFTDEEKETARVYLLLRIHANLKMILSEMDKESIYFEDIDLSTFASELLEQEDPDLLYQCKDDVVRIWESQALQTFLQKEDLPGLDDNHS